MWIVFSELQQELQVWFQLVVLGIRQQANVSEEPFVRVPPSLLLELVEMRLELLEDRVRKPRIDVWPAGLLTPNTLLAHGVDPRWRSTSACMLTMVMTMVMMRTITHTPHQSLKT